MRDLHAKPISIGNESDYGYSPVRVSMDLNVAAAKMIEMMQELYQSNGVVSNANDARSGRPLLERECQHDSVSTEFPIAPSAQNSVKVKVLPGKYDNDHEYINPEVIDRNTVDVIFETMPNIPPEITNALSQLDGDFADYILTNAVNPIDMIREMNEKTLKLAITYVPVFPKLLAQADAETIHSTFYKIPRPCDYLLSLEVDIICILKNQYSWLDICFTAVFAKTNPKAIFSDYQLVYINKKIPKFNILMERIPADKWTANNKIAVGAANMLLVMPETMEKLNSVSIASTVASTTETSTATTTTTSSDEESMTIEKTKKFMLNRELGTWSDQEIHAAFKKLKYVEEAFMAMTYEEKAQVILLFDNKDDFLSKMPLEVIRGCVKNLPNVPKFAHFKDFPYVHFSKTLEKLHFGAVDTIETTKRFMLHDMLKNLDGFDYSRIVFGKKYNKEAFASMTNEEIAYVVSRLEDPDNYIANMPFDVVKRCVENLPKVRNVDGFDPEKFIYRDFKNTFRVYILSKTKAETIENTKELMLSKGLLEFEYESIVRNRRHWKEAFASMTYREMASVLTRVKDADEFLSRMPISVIERCVRNLPKVNDVFGFDRYKTFDHNNYPRTMEKLNSVSITSTVASTTRTSTVTTTTTLSNEKSMTIEKTKRYMLNPELRMWRHFEIKAAFKKLKYVEEAFIAMTYEEKARVILLFDDMDGFLSKLPRDVIKGCVVNLPKFDDFVSYKDFPYYRFPKTLEKLHFGAVDTIETTKRFMLHDIMKNLSKYHFTWGVKRQKFHKEAFASMTIEEMAYVLARLEEPDFYLGKLPFDVIKRCVENLPKVRNVKGFDPDKFTRRNFRNTFRVYILNKTQAETIENTKELMLSEVFRLIEYEGIVRRRKHWKEAFASMTYPEMAKVLLRVRDKDQFLSEMSIDVIRRFVQNMPKFGDNINGYFQINKNSFPKTMRKLQG
nr:hypothetical protein HmN_000412200 [Hymenolepis microstoma]